LGQGSVSGDRHYSNKRGVKEQSHKKSYADAKTLAVHALRHHVFALNQQNPLPTQNHLSPVTYRTAQKTPIALISLHQRSNKDGW